MSSFRAHRPAPSEAPSEADVRAELARILSSPRLQASERRRAFLRFIVEETLEGRERTLKGYTIATTVFGRDETFDPQADPVVRLEARRLRRDLNSYYVDVGGHDAVRIWIPTGSYIPRFDWHEGGQPAATSRHAEPEGPDAPSSDVPSGTSTPPEDIGANSRLRPWLAVVFACVLAVAATAWLLTQDDGRPAAGTGGRAMVVLPLDVLSSTDESRYLASGIRQQLIEKLMRFPGFRLYALPAGFAKDADVESASLGRRLGVNYVVSGSLRAEAETIRVAMQLVDAESGEVLWAESYDRPLTPRALIGLQTELAGEIATALGQPYGAVNDDLRRKLAASAGPSLRSYVCVLRAYEFRRDFAREKFEPAMDCLQRAVRRDPDYSDAWAMLGWLYLDAARIGFSDRPDRDIDFRMAYEATSRAVEIAPNSALALKAFAATNHFMGRYEESERVTRLALDLNPHDPEALAQLGWRLAARGRFEEGIPLLERAIDRSLNPPGWYFHLVAIDFYLKRDYARMLEAAERSADSERAVSNLLIAIAAAELGDRGKVSLALRKMAESETFARDPAAFLRRHGAVDEIVDALMAGLRKARQVEAGSRPPSDGGANMFEPSSTARIARP